jgi:hypothetical protein
MPPVTKKVFLASLECPGFAWRLLRTAKAQALSEADRFRMDQGREIGQLARQVHGGGAFVPPGPTDQAAARTRELLNDDAVDILYEATFKTAELVAKADVLRREPDGWHLLEVKQAVNDKPEDVQDLSYTVMVARRSGVPISRASLILVSKDYRKGMPPERLFVDVDHTADVDPLVTAFADHWQAVRGSVLGEDPPEPELRLACRYCEEFSESCVGKGIPDPLFHLPRLHESKFRKLRELGVDRITAIPHDFKLTDRQEIVRQSVVSGRPWVSPDLRDALAAVRWPAFYLDFETTATVLPLFEGVAPHEVLPTQYSIHVYADLATELDHKEFLADHSTDGRRVFAERLLADLGEAGSVIVYTGYEQRVLRYLAALYPDLAERVERGIARLLDLEAIVGNHYYHPDFRGKTSIKVTLPALVPGVGYDHLAIRSGGDASALFARMARGEKTGAECGRIRHDLLEYCKQDTLAMVEVHRALMAAIP